jgi:hypothetical protein
MSEVVNIPSAPRKLNYQTYEVGPVNSEDLLFFIERVPQTEVTTFFGFNFLAEQGIVPRSSAELNINLEEGRLDLNNVKFPYSKNQSQFETILNGGKLENLILEFPGSQGLKKKCPLGGKAFEIMKENLEILGEAGYDLVVRSFILVHYVMDCTTSRDATFYSKSYTGKVIVNTEELIKDQPERKLVLSYTPDIASSDEVSAYRKILDNIGSSIRR